MMSNSGATYAPTLSPLSIGHMLISARSMARPPYRKNPCEIGVRNDAAGRYNAGMKHFSPLCGRGMLKWVALAAAIALPVPALRAAPADEATAAPATQPADRHDQQGTTKVLLLPFQAVGGRPNDSWIGRSIQQSLLTDLVMGGPIQVSTSSNAAADPNAAVDAGKSAGARYVVFGQVHVNDRGEGMGSAVRITAQLLDTTSGRAVGVLKSTGSIDDLFPVEDELAEQARHQLTRLQHAAGLEPDRGAGEPRPTIEASGPVRMGIYSNADWMDAGSSIPSAASNRYYFGNP